VQNNRPTWWEGARGEQQTEVFFFTFETDFAEVEAGPQIETWQRRSAAATQIFTAVYSLLEECGSFIPARFSAEHSPAHEDRVVRMSGRETGGRYTRELDPVRADRVNGGNTARNPR
jgi:hypothetical protein